MKCFAFLLIFNIFIISSYAHMCLLSPPQRGEMNDINTANTQDCGWTTGPCGGQAMQDPYVAFIRGQNFTISWQKNQNHWYSNNPGSFNLSWADIKDPSTFIPLYSFVDSDSPSLTIYSYSLDVDAMIPEDSKMGIFSLAYITPGLPVNFYQCADVIVL